MMVNKRRLLESVNELVRARQPNAMQIVKVLALLELVINDMVDPPQKLLMVDKEPT